MNAAFLLVAAPLGIVAAAWCAAAAVRLREPHGYALRPRMECTCCGASGSLRDTVVRLAGGECSRCGSKPPRWVLRAEAAGAAIPVMALYFSAEPGQAAAVTLSGWLLLGIWIADEVSLWIPHAFWGAGLIVGLGSLAYAHGVAAAGWRAMEAMVLVAALAAGSIIARQFTRIPAMGLADYGVIAFLGVALGYDATLDVLLVTGILALGFVAVRAARPRARRSAFTLAIAAVLATLLLGIPGAVIAGAALGAWVHRGRRRARATALPFGALLAAGALILITWTARPARPSAAAEAGAAHLRTHDTDQP